MGDGSPARVALTGATGFIGRQLQASLLDHGHAVRVLVRPASRNRGHILPACEVHEVPLTEPRAIAGALEGVDAAIYCAGSVRGARFADFEHANVIGARAMAQAVIAQSRDIPLLLISSLAASRPEVSHYARSKFEGERAVQSIARLEWSIIRPPAVYGPNDREMLPLLQAIRRGIAPIPGPAGQRLSLLHVEDLARAVLAWLAHHDRCGEQLFAIDDGREGGYDWDAIIAAVARGGALKLPIPRPLLAAVAGSNAALARWFGYAPMLTPGKVRELWQPEWLCDNAAFSAATRWRPRIALADGARQLFGGA